MLYCPRSARPRWSRRDPRWSMHHRLRGLSDLAAGGADAIDGSHRAPRSGAGWLDVLRFMFAGRSRRWSRASARCAETQSHDESLRDAAIIADGDG